MESTLLSLSSSRTNSTMSILSLTKSLNSKSLPLVAHLNRTVSAARSNQLARLQLSYCIQFARFGRGPRSVDLNRSRLLFAAHYSASSAGGGGFGGNVGGGGGGGGGDGGADKKPSAVAAGAADTAPLGSDVIILDVGGMTCGGCAASVKRILESQPQVSSANVNLTTETAIVWPVSEAKVTPNWRKDVGEALAKHLTTCGFTSNLRDEEAINEDIQL